MEQMSIAGIPVEELAGESWEGALDHLTADMDPWDIDVARLAQRYRAYIDSLQHLRFVIPGRMILTCSTLLRMKSDVLLHMGRPVERDELLDELEGAVDDAAEAWQPPDDPGDVSLPVRRKPSRQVTLLDLKAALTDAFKVTRQRASRLLRQTQLDDKEDDLSYLQFDRTDFADRLYGLYDRIRNLLTNSRVLSFFRLLDQGDKEERVRRFLEVLHLEAQQKITCTQDDFLGDIVISLDTET